MITAVLTPNPQIASAFASKFELAKIPTFGSVTEAYRKDDIVVAVSDKPDAITELRAEFLPERLYYASFGISTTSERYAGDVVLPNAFVPYSQNGDEEEGEATFLENYEQQEDYDFEAFGLSIGGVCVSLTEEPDDELLMKIASEYGADVVDENGCATMAAVSEGDEFGLYPLYGVVGGIVGNETEEISESAVANNMVSVFRFLEDTFENEEGTAGDEEDDVTSEENDE